MPFSRSRVTTLAAVALLLAGAAGCRGADPPATTSSAGMKTDFGVTKEACPKPVNATKGCIYLGTISDLTVGPFAPLAVPITKAQVAFWNRVNKAGGIGGYMVDVTKYRKENTYNTHTHKKGYQSDTAHTQGPAQTPRRPNTH